MFVKGWTCRWGGVGLGPQVGLLMGIIGHVHNVQLPKTHCLSQEDSVRAHTHTHPFILDFQ